MGDGIPAGGSGNGGGSGAGRPRVELLVVNNSEGGMSIFGDRVGMTRGGVCSGL
eukprot:GAFH01003099.1.p5 GENE.GAFH01003099.1~~GAFH01003099.1.p5  ORF type:complete len:54 (-),score=5.06 GAFH01003099.1:334-495(-)